MKTISEYNSHDLKQCLEQADQIAMCAISSIHNDINNHEDVSYEDLHCVKKGNPNLKHDKRIKENIFVITVNAIVY